jgi:hypothetical protein
VRNIPIASAQAPLPEDIDRLRRRRYKAGQKQQLNFSAERLSRQKSQAHNLNIPRKWTKHWSNFYIIYNFYLR